MKKIVLFVFCLCLAGDTCRPPLASFDVHRLELENGYLHTTGGMATENRTVEVDYTDNRRIVHTVFDSQGTVTLTNVSSDARKIKYRHEVAIPRGEYTTTQHQTDYEVCASDGKVTFYTEAVLASMAPLVIDWVYAVEIDLYGDFNDDGAIDGYDLGLFFSNWGLDGDTDINGDGITNGEDLGILFENWTG